MHNHIRTSMLGAVLSLTLVSGPPSDTHAQGSSAIRLESPWARRVPIAHGGPAAGAGNGVAFVTIFNQGGDGDALIAATSSAAERVELHEVRHQDGAMKMQPVAKFDVPAKGVLELKPGGQHLMLLGLKTELKSGDIVKIDLRFERAGSLTIEAPVGHMH